MPHSASGEPALDQLGVPLFEPFGRELRQPGVAKVRDDLDLGEFAIALQRLLTVGQRADQHPGPPVVRVTQPPT